MAKMTLNAEEVLSIYPELKGFTLDGQSDFNRIAAVIGSKDPNIVWAIVNSLKQKPDDDRLARLKGMLVR